MPGAHHTESVRYVAKPSFLEMSLDLHKGTSLDADDSALTLYSGKTGKWSFSN